jgi:parvulin-like peptidyl-prolyl isomerase
VLKRLLREPLVHFLLLGALLFGVSTWQDGGGAGAGSDRIVITAGVVEHLAAGFSRTWQRPPSDIELKGLIDEHVKQEIAAREALALGLDRDDVVIQRRLRQKLEFLLVDDAAAAPPTDAELKAWLERHPEAFRTEPQVSFRQVLLRTDRRGASAQADAARLLSRLRSAGSELDTAQLGDASMLPADLPMQPLRDVSNAFGSDFADALLKVEPGQWSGPVASGFGLHLVLVRQRSDGAAADLATVRPLVEREVLAERRKGALQALYDRLLAKYSVRIDSPNSPPAAGDARGAP